MAKQPLTLPAPKASPLLALRRAGRQAGHVHLLTARRSCSASHTAKILENSLTYWVMFNLQTRRLLPGIAGTFIPLDRSCRQLAMVMLHELSLLIQTSQTGGILAPTVPGCPWHRNWLHTQAAQGRAVDHSCKPVFLCNCSITKSKYMHSYFISAEGWQLFYVTPTKARPPLIAHFHFLVAG